MIYSTAPIIADVGQTTAGIPFNGADNKYAKCAQVCNARLAIGTLPPLKGIF